MSPTSRPQFRDALCADCDATADRLALELQQRRGIDRRHQDVSPITQQRHAPARVRVRSSQSQRSGRALEGDVPEHWQTSKAPSFLLSHILRRCLCPA